jgi:glutathione-specific gamma-glutamylcyclotransferase
MDFDRMRERPPPLWGGDARGLTPEQILNCEYWKRDVADSDAHDIWIFGYGSLMWRPGFAFAQRCRARLDGYHRAFCISSTHHRGNAKRPGLVLGLDRGGACEGVVYRIAAADAHVVLGYLRKRELVNGVYREARLPVQLHDTAHAQVTAITYICERAHPSYTGQQVLRVQAHQIRGARGVSGDNLDYLLSTMRQLADLGIREPALERLVTLCAPHAARFMGADFTCMSSAPIRRAVAHLPDRAQRMRRGERMRFLYRMRLEGW